MELSGDIMFVNKIPFFDTISRRIKFSTIEHTHTRKGRNILKTVGRVIGLYAIFVLNDNYIIIYLNLELLCEKILNM